MKRMNILIRPSNATGVPGYMITMLAPIAYWTIAIFLAAAGVWISTLNAYVAFRYWCVDSTSVPSMIPLIGGSILALGIYLVPYPQVSKWFWVAFVIDYGCILGMGYAALWHARRVIRR